MPSFWDEDYEPQAATDVPPGVYVIEASDDFTEEEWDDGRPYVNFGTKIVGGQYDGSFGPRVTLTIGESHGTTAKGREFTVAFDDTVRNVRRVFEAFLDGDKPEIAAEPESDPAGVLREVATIIGGRRAIVQVKLDKGGYLRATRWHKLAEPPKGFHVPSEAEAFTL